MSYRGLNRGGQKSMSRSVRLSLSFEALWLRIQGRYHELQRSKQRRSETYVSLSSAVSPSFGALWLRIQERYHELQGSKQERSETCVSAQFRSFLVHDSGPRLSV